MRHRYLLRVSTPHFVAGAIWTKVNNSWICVTAAPILKWMIRMTSEDLKNRKSSMLRKGWEFEWVAIGNISNT